MVRMSERRTPEDRSKHINGLEEILNDGVTQSWQGHIFTSYAGQTRNQEIGEGLNSVPYFIGNSTTGAGGQLGYSQLLTPYLKACKGDRKPDLGLTNKGGFGFLLNRIQAQQMFSFSAVGQDAVYGAASVKFMTMDIMIDEYAPSQTSQFGSSNAKLGDWTVPSTVTISGSPASGSNIPSSGTFVPGEPLLMLNTSTFKWRNSSHPLFNWGFTGYKPAINSTKISGQILVMGNLLCNAPWLNIPIIGRNFVKGIHFFRKERSKK
jgi:hypothetical protein